jgi:dTDP-4-dehydrorhamnose 3,5-epimerase
MAAPQFDKHETALDDVFILQRSIYTDERGSFGKIFNKDTFAQLGLQPLEFRELIYSVSSKNVIRGMHWQAYPYGTAKLISVVQGSILDVVVGIGGKHNTRNYGKTFSVELSATNNKTLLIPDGYAHGFKSLEDNTIVVYLQSQIYSCEHEKGMHYQSFGFDWRIVDPIVSDKDQALPPLKASAS